MRLVVFPTVMMADTADRSGLVRDDETWVTLNMIQTGWLRGRLVEDWRYVNDLDPKPGPGASPEVVEEWLDSPDRSATLVELPIEIQNALLFAAWRT